MTLYKKLRLQAPVSNSARQGLSRLTASFLILLGFSLEASALGEKKIHEDTIPQLSFLDEDAGTSLQLSDLLKSGNSILFVKEGCEPCLRMLKSLKSCDFQQPLIVVAAGPAAFQAQVRRLLASSQRLLKISLESLIKSTPGTPFLILPNESTHFGTLRCSELKTRLAAGTAGFKGGANR